MPKALDRLLASPSALRTLRAILSAPHLPSACSPTTNCCNQAKRRRLYSSKPKSAKGASQPTNGANVLLKRANGGGKLIFGPASVGRESNVHGLAPNRPEVRALGEVAIDLAEGHEK